MTKAKLNLIIDALLLVCLAAIAGIGLLIKYVLIPGFQRWEVYGRNVELLFWGMDRHEWGTIHLCLGGAFVALLVLHLVLHWGAIVALCRRLIPHRALRYLTATILVVLTALLLGFSALVKPQVRQAGRGSHRGQQRREPAHRMQRYGARGRPAPATSQGERSWQTTGREEDSWEPPERPSQPEQQRRRHRGGRPIDR